VLAGGQELDTAVLCLLEDWSWMLLCCAVLAGGLELDTAVLCLLEDWSWMLLRCAVLAGGLEDWSWIGKQRDQFLKAFNHRSSTKEVL
jgi:hypothetical protein